MRRNGVGAFPGFLVVVRQVDEVQAAWRGCELVVGARSGATPREVGLTVDDGVDGLLPARYDDLLYVLPGVSGKGQKRFHVDVQRRSAFHERNPLALDILNRLNPASPAATACWPLSPMLLNMLYSFIGPHFLVPNMKEPSWAM